MSMPDEPTPTKQTGCFYATSRLTTGAQQASWEWAEGHEKRDPAVTQVETTVVVELVMSNKNWGYDWLPIGHSIMNCEFWSQKKGLGSNLWFNPFVLGMLTYGIASYFGANSMLPGPFGHKQSVIANYRHRMPQVSAWVSEILLLSVPVLGDALGPHAACSWLLQIGFGPPSAW